DVKGQLKNTDSGEALKVDDNLYVTGDTTIDGAITSAVWNGDAIDISSYSNLAAGTGVTLSGDTLNVDDDYVKNTGDTVNGDLTVTGDVATTGTHTASGILNSKTGNILTGLSITDADGCDTPNLVTFDVAADLSDVRIGDIFTDEDSARFEITGINDAGDSLSIIGTCTFNGSDDATVSRPSLLADGDVGIGVDVPLTALDVAGALRLSTPNINAFEFGNAYNIYYSESAVFQLKTTGNSRIFEVTDDTDFFFDNVDVYPDNDNAQSLGLTTNRWSEVHATEGDFSTIVMPETSSKGTCDATTKGTMTYEVIASVGTFYGCTQTGASSYAWAAFH
ncbi:MAG: hypothetical protein Q8P90_00005, partial [bacterium]|nr:hypothetical protein [bacterium]